MASPASPSVHEERADEGADKGEQQVARGLAGGVTAVALALAVGQLDVLSTSSLNTWVVLTPVGTALASDV